MNKHMKIMAILAVFLVATLFVGVTAADAGNFNVTLTPDKTTVNIGDTVTFTLANNTNAGITADTTFLLNMSSTSDMSTNSTVGTFANLAVGSATTPKLTWVPTTEGTFYFSVYNSSDVSGQYYNASIQTIVASLGSNVRAINTSGTDAFVYEHIYIAGATKLTKYSDGANPSVVNQIAGTSGIFYLTEAVVNGQYGTYNVTVGSVSTKQISIWYPEITLQGELTTGTAADGKTSGDSIDGKSINKDSMVTFLINSPKVAPAFTGNTANPAAAKIVFTTPAGGKTTVFGDNTDNNFANVPLTGSQTIAASSSGAKGVIIGTNAEAGTWIAQAEYLTAPFNDYAKKSNTISFTVQSTSLTLTAAKDSVVRSNPFTVAIQGDSQMMYFIYLDGASATDNNPAIQPGQSGMKVKDNSDVVLTPAVYKAASLVQSGLNTQTWGYFETDASGKRTVQYNTFANTEDKTYTVKVYAVGTKYENMVADPATGAVTIPKDADYDSVKVKVEKGAVTITASGDGSYYIGQEIKLTGTNTDSSYVYLFMTGPNLDNNGIVLKDIPGKNPGIQCNLPGRRQD